MTETENLRQLMRIAGGEMKSAERRYKEALRALNDARSAAGEEGASAAIDVIDHFVAGLDTPDNALWRKVDWECRQAIQR
jgi:hypothetical protein